MKAIRCEVSSVETFAYLVNRLMEQINSLHTLHQTYDRGLVDNAVEGWSRRTPCIDQENFFW
jgi:hypothetical protein